MLTIKGAGEFKSGSSFTGFLSRQSESPLKSRPDRALRERFGSVLGILTRLTIVTLLFASLVTPKAASPALPDNFIDEVVVPNLNVVTTMEFLPDGKILLAERGG